MLINIVLDVLIRIKCDNLYRYMVKQVLLPLNYRLFQEQYHHQREMAIDDNKVEVSVIFGYAMKYTFYEYYIELYITLYIIAILYIFIVYSIFYVKLFEGMFKAHPVEAEGGG